MLTEESIRMLKKSSATSMPRLKSSERKYKPLEPPLRGRAFNDDMDILKELTRLNERFMTAESEAEEAAVNVLREELIAAHPEREAELREHVAADALRIARALSVESKMEPVLDMISCNFIAKQYFCRTRSWFQQRLNGNVIHGKRCHFTDSDIEVLRSALRDMARRLESVAESL